MAILDSAIELLGDSLPLILTLAGVALAVFVTRRLLISTDQSPGNRFRNQATVAALIAVGALAVLLSLPVPDSMKGQLLSLVGILSSAAIALSSTTFLGNAMAGVMLRSIRNFRSGDFVRVGDHFGRVSARGLFHTELQTEDRDLTTLPNLYLITHPVTVVRSSGTIISVILSLGYDVQRQEVERILLEAAVETELAEPFVHVTELGDCAVSYRVAGLLTEVKQLLSSRSKLRKLILDHFHAAGIEIASPRLVASRTIEDELIPHTPSPTEALVPEPENAPEDVIFDKAEAAETIEFEVFEQSELELELKQAREELGKCETEQDKQKLQTQIAQLEERLSQNNSKLADETSAQ